MNLSQHCISPTADKEPAFCPFSLQNKQSYFKQKKHIHLYLFLSRRPREHKRMSVLIIEHGKRRKFYLLQLAIKSHNNWMLKFKVVAELNTPN